MRAAICQLAPDYSVAAADLREAVAAQVRAVEADLVVLPELWPVGGFTYERWEPLAEPVDGPTATLLAEVARDRRCWLHGGSIVERAADGRLFNTSLLFAPDGSLAATYRKIHLFGFDEGEPAILAAGDELVTVDSPFGRIGLATCYDLRFPEQFRALVDAGATVILVPAAWPAARVAHWSLLARARAVENQVAIVACNTAGEQAGKRMGGASLIVDATGKVLAEAGDGSEVVLADLDLAVTADWRQRFPALADRRRDLFG